MTWNNSGMKTCLYWPKNSMIMVYQLNNAMIGTGLFTRRDWILLITGAIVQKHICILLILRVKKPKLKLN